MNSPEPFLLRLEGTGRAESTAVRLLGLSNRPSALLRGREELPVLTLPLPFLPWLESCWQINTEAGWQCETWLQNALS